MHKHYLMTSVLVVFALFIGLCWAMGSLRDSVTITQRQTATINNLQSEISILENDIRSLTSERNEAAAIARKLLGITDSN